MRIAFHSLCFFIPQTGQIQAEAATGKDLVDVAGRLDTLTDPNREKLYAGDVVTAVDILDSLVLFSNHTLKNMSKETVDTYAQVGSV